MRSYRPPIRKLYRPLRWVWVGFVPVLVTMLVGRWLAGGLFEDKGFALQPPVLAALHIYCPWALLVLLVLAGLILLARRDEHRHKAFSSFDLLEPAKELRPEDLNFRVLEAGEEPLAQDKRPLYKSSYIPRVAVLYEQRADKNPRRFSEEQLLGELRKNKGFVLQGPPLDGKSHTLYEIVRHMEGYEVLRPKRREKVPDEEDFSLLLKGRRVVLLLDDLTQYVGSELNLYEFGQRLGRYAPNWVVASTCRDGPEMGTVKEATGNGLKRFYDDIPQKLQLRELAPKEKEQLAENIGKRLTPKDSEQYPTPGSITMEEFIRFMKNRFSDLNLEQRDILRALKLLATAGVLPFSQERIQAVLEHVFNRSSSELGDCLNALADQAFLRSGSQEPVDPERAYLRDAVSYTGGKTPQDDFANLADVLKERKDAEGLFYLGTTYGSNLEAYEQALVYFEEAIRLNPNYPETWYNKGVTLSDLGEYQKALEAYDEAIRLNPDYPEAWYNKGALLDILGEHQKALETYDEAIRLNPDYPEAWYNKGLNLSKLNEYREALEAFEEALRLNPDYPKAWYDKGVTLAKLASAYEERTQSNLAENMKRAIYYYNQALAAVEEVLRLNPNYPNAWYSKGVTLSDLGEHRKALEAFSKALKLNPDYPHAWYGRGQALGKLREYREALEAFEEALRLNPDYPKAWHSKGVALSRLSEHHKALAAFEEALRLNPNCPKAWYNKGVTLYYLANHDEAVKWLCRAWCAREDLPDSEAAIAKTLRQLGRDPKECMKILTCSR